MTKRVAVIGYAFRFPVAADVQTSDASRAESGRYWESLEAGHDLVTEIENGRWEKSAFQHPDKAHPGTSYTNAAGSIGDISKFDAGFFGISPREAALMDPQQRLLLEMSWEALENSGVKPSSMRGSDCGVFIGIASADYFYRLMDDLSAIDASVATGNTSSIAANRLSYFFDLRGPSLAIDTACSSSLIAFHQACQSILSGESTQAITGGVSLHIHPAGFVMFSKASMLSKRGRCNVFDATGDGYVRSEGGGIFYLKDYDAAVADGNRILAVVAGSGVNTDGRKSGLTVPCANAQASLLESVYAKAKIHPNEVDYIEAHGTGTAVGDPIETRALGMALGIKRAKDKPLLIGSVKSNIGHLEAASGVAGLVKSLLSIQHRSVPATIGIKTPNPNIKFNEWNLRVVTANTPLKRNGKLIIGTNSFGFGGANAHVILESYDSPEAKVPRLANIPEVPVVISAKSKAGLADAVKAMVAYLRSHPTASIYDIAYTTCFHRDWHAERAVVFGNSVEAVVSRLNTWLDTSLTEPAKATQVDTATVVDAAKGPAFVFTGNGSQWAKMGKTLLAEDVTFRNAVRAVDVIFKRYANFSLEAELSGANVAASTTDEDRFSHTEIAQPALFALQVGLVAMLQHRGVTPAAVVGHSVGEVAAAWASGALSLEDAVKVIYYRSQLQGQTRGLGKMTAVSLDAASAQAMLDSLGLASSIVISGFNSAQGITVAGASDSLTVFERHLTTKRIVHKRLNLDYAFHSPAMDAIELPVEQSLASIKASETALSLYSTVTGDVIDGRELHATYWWYNIRHPVLFEQAINTMIADGINVFIEIGPHAILRSYIKESLDHSKDVRTNDSSTFGAIGAIGKVIPTLMRGHDEPQRVWSAASQAILAGVRVTWPTLLPWRGRFVQLPTYAWQRETHWIPTSSESGGLLARKKIHPLLGYALPHRFPNQVWENEIDLQLAPSYRDHVVGGATLFPGAGFVEIACAVGFASQSLASDAKNAAPATWVEIEALEIRAPLSFSAEHSLILQSTLDAADGTISIAAREKGNASFALHATARLLTSANKANNANIANSPPVAEFGDVYITAIADVSSARFQLPSRAPDFDVATQQILTRIAGLTYGEAYSAIDIGWVDVIDGRKTATAKFADHASLPASLQHELPTHHLHPALLDCTFQLIIQLLRDEVFATPGYAFVPVRIERFAIAVSTAKPYAAHARLLRNSRHSVTAAFDIFDVNGNVIASFQDVRFQNMRLQKNENDHMRHLRFKRIGQPHPADSATVRPSLIAFEKLTQRLADVFEGVDHPDGVENSNRAFIEEVDPLLDALCRAYVQKALLGLANASGELSLQSLESLAPNHEVKGRLATLITFAVDDGIMVPADNGWQLTTTETATDAAEPSAEDIWHCLNTEFPDYFALYHPLGRIGYHLPHSVPGLSPSDQSQSLSHSRSYTPYFFGRHGIEALAQAVRAELLDIISTLPQSNATRSSRFAITEIGDSPRLTNLIYPMIDADKVDFNVMLTGASRPEDFQRFMDIHPAVTLDYLDLSTRADALSTSRSDIVILSLGQTNAAELANVIACAGARLAPGGALIVLSHYSSLWQQFGHALGVASHAVSLQNGYQMASQTASIVPATIVPTPEMICAHLLSAGLSGVRQINLSRIANSGAVLLMATRGEMASPQAGLMPSSATIVEPVKKSVVALVIDEHPSAAANALLAALGTTLREQGHVVIDFVAHDAATALAAPISTWLNKNQQRYGTVDTILHIAGFDAAVDDDCAHSLLADDTGLQAPTRRCMIAAAIAEACEANSLAANCWMVTHGGAPGIATAGNVVKTSLDRASENTIADAMLWGWCRTLMNEVSVPAIRLVEIAAPTAENVSAIAAAVVCEIIAPTAESEVIFTASGERQVLRLDVIPSPGATNLSYQPQATINVTTKAASHDAIKLGFDSPGQLKNLYWQHDRLRVMNELDVLIEVRATGLNFRDVMYALGILTDAAIENGFAGATLGLEFAGVVQSVGSGVTAFAPGDKVVGFGAGCFGNRIITDSRAVTHLPDLPQGMSFESGATIPSTFFTAYYAFVHLARLQKGERVLIHGAAGGVGLAAIQIAKLLGAEIFATAGSDDKRDALRLLGVPHIYDSRSLAFADEILRDTNGVGVDIVLNSLAGEAINRNFSILKPFGRFIELGKRDFYENTKIGLRPFRNNISFFGVDADQLMREHPALTQTLFAEIMALFAEGKLHALPHHAFEAAYIVDAFRYMQQAKQIGKVVVTYQQPIPDVRPVQTDSSPVLALDANASYLVTGGLSGFGLKTAGWLANKGAKHLVLIGRSGAASNEAIEGIAKLRAMNIRVEAIACDVTNRAAVAALISQFNGQWPPLKGIIHAAMVIEDGLVRTTNTVQLQNVLAPKIQGAYLLHELTMASNINLDFFVLYSSATTLFGNPGQASYVAANTWLESFAQQRRALGLPATVVCWGAIDDVGYLARNSAIKDALQNRMGGNAIPSKIALRTLENMLLVDQSGIAVMDLDWRTLSRFLPTADSPKYTLLAQSIDSTQFDDTDEHDVRKMVSELSNDALLAMFTSIIQAEVADILRAAPDKIDTRRSMFEMGLDSLMGVELATALEARFGVRLPAMMLTEHPTITKLAARLVTDLQADQTSTAMSDAADINDALLKVQQIAKQHSVQLSDAQLTDLAQSHTDNFATAPSGAHKRMIH